MQIAEVVARWPETARVFNQNRMACVGCAFDEYCTVADAAREYGLSVDALIAVLIDETDKAKD